MAEIPEIVRTIVHRVDAAGGRALLVGGAVVDAVLEIPIKDWDIEVYGLDYEELSTMFQDMGPKEVGKAFGIIKLDSRLTDGHDIDINIPRREDKIGKGHKDVSCTLDPRMTPRAAAERRDLTINSMAWDLYGGRIIDHFGGMSDLEHGIIRATNPKTFVEDPLRALRVMQLLPRKGTLVDPQTMQLIKSMSYQFPYLPKERIYEEFRKLFMKADKPSVGLEFLRESGWLKWFPQIGEQIGTLQNPKHHPEGDVWTHMLHVADAAALVRHRLPEEWQEPFMLGATLHDVGKVHMTITKEHQESGIGPDGKPLYDGQDLYSAHGHDSYGIIPGSRFMDLLTDNRKLKEKVLMIILKHMFPYYGRDAGPSFFKRLNNDIPLNIIGYMALCDHCGRPHRGIGDPDLNSVYSQKCFDMFEQIGPEPTPQLLMGRDLIEAGFKPGPDFGVALKAAYEAQLDDEELTKHDLLMVATQAI